MITDQARFCRQTGKQVVWHTGRLANRQTGKSIDAGLAGFTTNSFVVGSLTNGSFPEVSMVCGGRETVLDFQQPV